jgi:hypothetical protein
MKFETRGNARAFVLVYYYTWDLQRFGKFNTHTELGYGGTSYGMSVRKATPFFVA